MVVMALLLGLAGGFILGRELGPNVASAGLNVNRGPSISLPPDLVQLAAGWTARCGNGRGPLIECSCTVPQGGVEIKRYMLELYSAGTPLNVIRQKVTERFGAIVTGGSQ